MRQASVRYNPSHMSQLQIARAARRVAIAVFFIVVASTPASAGDAFFRGGVIFHPREVDLEGRWRVAFGSDYAVNFAETAYVGFELQTSVFRQDVLGSTRTATLIPANGFVNVKYKSSNIGVRPYGGGGLGLISTFVVLSGANDWNNDLGFHLLGGVELGRLNIELQLQRAFESGAETNYALYAGFVW